MAKRVSARRVKIHRQYTYESAAEALGVTVQTVRAWRKEGLAVLDSQKPHLILGHDLKGFLDKRNPKTPGKLAPDHFFCMSCHVTRPAKPMERWRIMFRLTKDEAGWLCCVRSARRYAASLYHPKCANS